MRTYSVNVGRIERTRTRPVARAVAAFTVVLVLLSGTALTAGAQTSAGLSCSAGPSSIEMSWSGEFRAFQYTAWVRDSSGWESSQVVDWSRGSSESASVTFTGLALGEYTVWVIMRTVDGSWIKIGETSCTVDTAETTTTTTKTTSPTTTTTPPTITPASDEELGGYSPTTTLSPDIQLGGHSSTTPLSPEGQIGGL